MAVYHSSNPVVEKQFGDKPGLSKYLSVRTQFTLMFCSVNSPVDTLLVNAI